MLTMRATAIVLLLLGLPPAAMAQPDGTASIGLDPSGSAAAPGGTTEVDVRNILEARGYSQLCLRADRGGWVGTATTPDGERVLLDMNRHGTIEEIQ